MNTEINHLVRFNESTEGYRHQVKLPAGELTVYAAQQLFSSLDYKVFEMANNNLQIPGISYMGYTPDVHVGVGTCIGTTAVWEAQSGYVSPSIVGSDIGCGMRVHMTNLHKDDLKEVKLRRKLVKAIEKVLPMEANQRGPTLLHSQAKMFLKENLTFYNKK